jgi:hypothetical protein
LEEEPQGEIFPGTPAEPGSPIQILNRETGETVLVVHDLALADVFLDAFFLYRSYPIIMTYPILPKKMEKRTVPWLWTPDKNRSTILESFKDGSNWEYVTSDIINGLECAFFRNADVVGLAPQEANRYYKHLLSGYASSYVGIPASA